MSIKLEQLASGKVDDRDLKEIYKVEGGEIVRVWPVVVSDIPETLLGDGRSGPVEVSDINNSVAIPTSALLLPDVDKFYQRPPTEADPAPVTPDLFYWKTPTGTQIPVDSVDQAYPRNDVSPAENLVRANLWHVSGPTGPGGQTELGYYTLHRVIDDAALRYLEIVADAPPQQSPPVVFNSYYNNANLTETITGSDTLLAASGADVNCSLTSNPIYNPPATMVVAASVVSGDVKATWLNSVNNGYQFYDSNGGPVEEPVVVGETRVQIASGYYGYTDTTPGFIITAGSSVKLTSLTVEQP